LIKLGLVGLGKMGLLHLRNARFMESVKVTAVADPSNDRLEVARSLGVGNVFTSYREVLKTDIDAVILTLPNYMHDEVLIEAAEAGKHIFVEKPLAITSKDCEVVIDAVGKNGVLATVGHNYRYLDCVRKIREIKDRGEIGDVEIATEELIINGPFAPSLRPSPVPDWYFDKEKIGMGCMDSGYHLIDLFIHLFGEANVLYAFLGNRFHLPYEDHAIVVLKSKRCSAKGVINVGWFSKTVFPKFNFRIILHGTTGHLSTEQFMPRNMYTYVAKEAVKNFFRHAIGKKITPLTYTYYYASLFEELKTFIDCVRKGIAPPVTLHDALRTVKIIEEIYSKFTVKGIKGF